MVILHFACIENDPFSGVCVATPMHVLSQSYYAVVGFININNKTIYSLQGFNGLQLDYEKPFNVNNLHKPFDKPDLVVFHECYRPDYLIISHNLRINNIPYVIIPHGELRVEAQRKKRIKKRIANIFLFNHFIDRALSIQCLSNAEMHSTNFGSNKFIGSNGINIPTRKKSEFNKNKTVFLYIGRYEWRVKGLDLLVEAVKQNEDCLRQNNCIFKLYGPDFHGQLTQVKELVNSNGLEDLMIINSEITGREKEKAYLEADVFIQCSRHEGLPMGVLEAMSYGLPCLVTAGTSMSNFIQLNDAGWGVATNVDGISGGIMEIMNNLADLVIKGENARTLVSEQFEWKNISEETVKTYQQLLEN